MRRLAVLILAVGCDAPYVDVADTSPGADAAVDTSVPPYFPDASRALPDGRLCEGHDEDLDSWADECDVCPGVADPGQIIGSEVATDEIGAACAPSALYGSLRRVFFDPLRSIYPSWTTGGFAAFRVVPEAPDEFIGGSTRVTSDRRGVTGFAIHSGKFSTAKVLVVLAGVEPSGGVGGDKIGVFVRGSGFAERFVGCFVSGSSDFGIVQTDSTLGCDAATCPLEPVGEIKRPSRVTWKRTTLRVEAVDLPDGRGLVTCTTFDANEHLIDKGPAEATVTVAIDAEHWGAADARPRIGLFAQHGLGTFSYVDVLAGL